MTQGRPAPMCTKCHRSVPKSTPRVSEPQITELTGSSPVELWAQVDRRPGSRVFPHRRRVRQSPPT